MDIDGVLSDLVALARQQPGLGLLQFRTRVSAEQYRRLYELVARHVPSGGAVLDWGAGNGHVAHALEKLGFSVDAYSTDPGPPPLLTTAITDERLRVVTGVHPSELPFADATFDAVLSVGVLEHVRETGGNELDSLREIRRVLKSTGVFMCYHLPNRYSYIEACARWIPGAHHHKFRFTRRSIERLCGSAGLELLDVARYATLPRNPWQVVPTRIANSQPVARAWDKLDEWAAVVFSPIAQNYYFVARPTSETG